MFIFAISAFTLVGCTDDDDNKTDNDISYNLDERSDSGIDGKIEFVELTDGRIQAEISLNGTTSGNTYPAHVHMNSFAEGGDIVISLESVAGATGSSVTVFETTDNGDAVTFDMIRNMDAYVNVHLSPDDLATVVAQGDIGSNTLTGESYTYDLDERAVEGISGTITFHERMNGYTLAEINLSNTPDGGSHPAHIHMNSFAEGGDILVTFTPVDGTTGTSWTGIRATDGGETLEYQDILNTDGYVNVHLSADELGTIVAQGDIGYNELTGESIDYALETKDVAGISGMITFYERKDGSALASIELVGTPNGGMHPAHIHENSAAESGPIAFTFNPVVGDTGMSWTDMDSFDDGSNLNYAMLDNYDGYVNVHKSAEELDVIVAQGDIGVNAD